jgi:hypothetical protein
VVFGNPSRRTGTQAQDALAVLLRQTKYEAFATKPTGLVKDKRVVFPINAMLDGKAAHSHTPPRSAWHESPAE